MPVEFIISKKYKILRMLNGGFFNQCSGKYIVQPLSFKEEIIQKAMTSGQRVLRGVL